MNWSAFLPIVRCPNLQHDNQPCHGVIERYEDTLMCLKCGHVYICSLQQDVPSLIIRNKEEILADRYEDPKNRQAEYYAGLWAFGYYVFKRGDAEGFYRTINELAMTTLMRPDYPYTILEIGCGIGRTASDPARHYPHAVVVGVDLSQRMLHQAYRIAVDNSSNQKIEVTLDNEGLGTVTVPRFNLHNIVFAQADALN